MSETTIEAVTMTDGSVVNFPGKRKMQKTSTIENGVVSVRLDFRNGEFREFEVPEELLLKFAAHGAEQKLGDAIAGLKEMDDAVIAIDDLTARLNKGEWGVTREANGMAGISVLVRALVEHTGKTVDAIKDFLAGKTQGEKLALRNNPKIKPIVDRIESEKASKNGSSVDTDALLGELDAE